MEFQITINIYNQRPQKNVFLVGNIISQSWVDARNNDEEPESVGSMQFLKFRNSKTDI